MRYYERIKRRQKIKEVAEFTAWGIALIMTMFSIVYVLPIMLGY
jgi:hypothetical protein